MTAEKALELLNDVEFAEKYQGVQEYTEMLIVCKETLEKQIPKKPIDKIDPMFGDIYIVCSNCENTAIVNPFTHSIFKRCPNCGQALDCNGIDDYFKNYNKEKEVGGNNNA